MHNNICVLGAVGEYRSFVDDEGVSLAHSEMHSIICRYECPEHAVRGYHAQASEYYSAMTMTMDTFDISLNRSDPLILYDWDRSTSYVPSEPYRCIKLSELSGDGTDNNEESIQLRSRLARELAIKHRAGRCGAMTVHSLGTICSTKTEEGTIDSTKLFYNSHQIFPYKYQSSRIFWSTKIPLTRRLYVFDILTTEDAIELGLEIPVETGFHIPEGWGVTSEMKPIFRVVIMNDGEETVINEHDDGDTGEVGDGMEVDGAGATSKEAVSAGILDEGSVVGEVPMEWEERDGTTSPPGLVDEIQVDPEAVQERSSRIEREKHYTILTYSVEEAYQIIMKKVMTCNENVHPNLRQHRLSMQSFGLNAYHFFGLGHPFVRNAIELLQFSISAVLAPCAPQYKPCHVLFSSQEAFRFQQLLLSGCGVLYNAAGSARAQGWDKKVHEVTRRVSKLLAKTVDDSEDAVSTLVNTADEGDDVIDVELIEENQRTMERNRQRYLQLSTEYKLNPLAKLQVRKSRIHGWGLFTRTKFAKNDMIVEYIGQKIRLAVADRREAQYEVEGVGSCYLFRLGKDAIIDATRMGGMARFMNHCCEPNAYARVISAIDNSAENDDDTHKHIIVFANREIEVNLVILIRCSSVETTSECIHYSLNLNCVYSYSLCRRMKR